MTEIAQLFESALKQNRSGLLRKAAMKTVARMPAATSLRELLQSDAGDAIRALSLADLRAALRDAGLGTVAAPQAPPSTTPSDAWSESREEQLFRQIMEQMTHEPQTIGQLSKRVDIDVEELRGYLTWMKKMGKIAASGKARATRYHAIAE